MTRPRFTAFIFLCVQFVLELIMCVSVFCSPCCVLQDSCWSPGCLLEDTHIEGGYCVILGVVHSSAQTMRLSAQRVIRWFGCGRLRHRALERTGGSLECTTAWVCPISRDTECTGARLCARAYCIVFERM